LIGARRVLALIPARGGSKGLPGKNIRPLGGRPLIAWTIEAAHASRHIDRTVLSSDDEAIIAAARAHGCEAPFRRPTALAADDTAAIDVVLHALDELPGHEVVVLLQPTSPLRTAADIDAACERFEQTGAPSCVTVTPVVQSPYWMYRLDDNGRLRALLDPWPGATRRQDLPEVVVLNGAVYVADAAWLRRERRFVGDDTVAVTIPAGRSVDIDTAADFDAAERALAAR